MGNRETPERISKGNGRVAWLLIGIIFISLGIASANSGNAPVREFIELAIVIPLGIASIAFYGWREG